MNACNHTSKLMAKTEQYDSTGKAGGKMVIVSPGGYSAAKMQVRNEYMIDHADLILAYYTGKPGGTANCVHYAEAQGKQIINLAEVRV